MKVTLPICYKTKTKMLPHCSGPIETNKNTWSLNKKTLDTQQRDPYHLSKTSDGKQMNTGPLEKQTPKSLPVKHMKCEEHPKT